MEYFSYFRSRVFRVFFYSLIFRDVVLLFSVFVVSECFGFL